VNWQPIETAPRDGSWFITANFNGCDEFEVSRYGPVSWPDYVALGNGMHERIDRIVSEFTSDNFHRATHWMPLPPPPKDIQGDEKI